MGLPDGRARLRPGETEPVLVPRVRLPDPHDRLVDALAAIRADLELPTSFPRVVAAEAHAAVARAPLPSADLTGIPFVTIDPPDATDLDQAVHLERHGDGTRVQYAIADLPAFVAPGGQVDAEARGRGQTLYAPDGRIPLHPEPISEGAASLLPGQVRGAFVWSFDLDAGGHVTSTSLVRGRVRSRRQLDYAQAQAEIDHGTADESLRLLRDVGKLRIALERERGGASLNRPDEEIVIVDGRYRLERRMPLPVEQWNAQISLLTGMQAARLMIGAGTGILRTMPAPDAETLARFRRQVALIGRPWPLDQAYGEYLRGLDLHEPESLAAVHAAASLFRGAGYTVLNGEPGQPLVQAAVAAPYAHATAPLRRLVDRFVLVACEAIVARRPVPDWVVEALPDLPAAMARSSALASRLERESVNAIEAALLSSRVGETFQAVVLGPRNGGGSIQLAEPFVTAHVDGQVEPGQLVNVVLESAVIETGEAVFRLA